MLNTEERFRDSKFSLWIVCKKDFWHATRGLITTPKCNDLFLKKNYFVVLKTSLDRRGDCLLCIYILKLFCLGCCQYYTAQNKHNSRRSRNTLHNANAAITRDEITHQASAFCRHKGMDSTLVYITKQFKFQPFSRLTAKVGN